jgi:hypothetical protein
MNAVKLATVEMVKSKASKSKAKRKVPARKARLTRGDMLRAGAFFGLALCGLAVSLPHLASEIGMLTGSGLLSAWLVSVVIDCGMVATKAHLSARGPNRAVAWTVLGACTLVSVVLNCHAFVSHATPGFGTAAAILFGVFLPLFNLALSYLGSAILLGHKD